VYANAVHISFTPFDVRLTFSFLETPHDQPPGAVPLPAAPPRAVGEVVLPAAIDSVLDLLRAELERYVERFGAPRPALQQAARRRRRPPLTEAAR